MLEYRLLSPAGAGRAAACSFAACTYVARAQWTAIDLNGPGLDRSHVNAVAPSVQAGWGVDGNFTHAMLWNGSASSWVDLTPSLSTNSGVAGVAAGQQVGFAGFHGAIWAGTPESMID